MFRQTRGPSYLICPLQFRIAISLFACVADGRAILQLRKRGDSSNGNDAVGLCGLLATLVGVMITAIGVFGWRWCWKRRRDAGEVKVLFPAETLECLLVL
jgi:hypothetical protein